MILLIIYIIFFAVASYLLGSIPFGVLLAKAFSRKNIRQSGSGNIGATNVARVLGKKLGILTFIGDMLKGFLPVFVGARIFQTQPQVLWAVCLFGFAAFLGHLFPVYLRFRGGKGVATAFGVFLYLAPAVMLTALALFMLVVALWRYISLGSLAVAVGVPIVLAGFSSPLPLILLSIVIGLLIFVKHKSNIQRLCSGTESKLGLNS